MGIGVILFGEFGELEVRTLMTTLTVTATSILGLACGAYYESGRGRILPLAGMALTITAAVMTFLIIWNVLDDYENFIKATITVMVLALSCSHLSLLSLARLDRRFAWSLVVAFVCVAALDAILLSILWFEPESQSDMVSRIIGVLSILIASITVITPVLHKLSSDESRPEIDVINAEIDQLRERIDELEAKKAELTQSALEQTLS